jgi:hypothetical protein
MPQKQVMFTFVQETESQIGKFEIKLDSLKSNVCHGNDGKLLKAKSDRIDPNEKEPTRADASPRANEQRPEATMSTILVEIQQLPAKSKLPNPVSVTCDVQVNPYNFTYTKFDMDFSFWKPPGRDLDTPAQTQPRADASTEIIKKLNPVVPPSAPGLSALKQPLSVPIGTIQGSAPTSSATANPEPEPKEVIQEILFKAEKDRFADEPYIDGGRSTNHSWSRYVPAGDHITIHWSNTQKILLKEIAIILVGIFGAAAIAAYVEAARPYIDRHGRRKT